jgi:colicin import membrane protein
VSPATTAQQFSAGALAMVVHLFFFAALVFGVSWKTLPALPVYADLWNALPALPSPPEPEPPLEPEVKPAPPLKPAPLPKPPPPVEKVPPKVDIAIKEKEEKRKRLEAEKRRQQELEEQRKLEEQRLREEVLKEEQRLEEQRRLEAKRKAEAQRLAQEKMRKDLEKALAEEMAADLAQERSRLAEAQQQAAASAAREKMVLDYRDRISLKIRGLLRLPPNLKGNPEAVFKVRLLANGEVVGVSLVKSSGQPAYDQEVERAILKASPLPLPPDREAAAGFRENLQLKFRPLEG